MPHAQAGTVSAASSEPSGSAGSNLWLESHVLCGNRWAQTWIPAEWNTRVEEKRATAGSWENRDKSWEPKTMHKWKRGSEEQSPEEPARRHQVCRPKWN